MRARHSAVYSVIYKTITRTLAGDPGRCILVLERRRESRRSVLGSWSCEDCQRTSDTSCLQTNDQQQTNTDRRTACSRVSLACLFTAMQYHTQDDSDVITSYHIYVSCFFHHDMVKLQETFVVAIVEYRKLDYFTDHRVCTRPSLIN